MADHQHAAADQQPAADQDRDAAEDDEHDAPGAQSELGRVGAAGVGAVADMTRTPCIDRADRRGAEPACHPPDHPAKDAASYGSGRVTSTAAKVAQAVDPGCMSTQADSSRITIDPTFGSILCGVDGSRPSFEAARQAALLAGDGAALTYVAVSWEQGVGANAVATLSHKRAQECLKRVRDDARELGVAAEVAEEEAEDPARRLMELAAGHDLLVIGILGHSRRGRDHDRQRGHRSRAPFAGPRPGRPPPAGRRRISLAHPARDRRHAPVGRRDGPHCAARRPARRACRHRRCAPPRRAGPARRRGGSGRHLCRHRPRAGHPRRAGIPSTGSWQPQPST